MTESQDSLLSGGSPPHAGQPDLTPEATLLGVVLKHQRETWRRGEPVLVETYLEQQPVLQADAQATLDLIYQEIVLREESGESPQLDEYRRRFPSLAPELEIQFEINDAIGRESGMRGDEHRTIVAGEAPRSSSPTIPAVRGYEMLGELGRGGMGVVYKARQLRLNRIVALKMILAADHASPEAAVRFMAEAASIARLHHPHIVQIFAFGDHDGRPYFEMEYVDGGSLADRIGPKSWPIGDAARLVETLARAIDAAHRLGVVHRDLKPANILLTADGIPKVADFGLAKCLDAETGMTCTEWIVGSPSYMAPEQAGTRGKPIGPQADVYSLGAILYELLTGRPPFQAATVLETLEQVRSADPITPARLRPKLPRDLAAICLKCLAKEPAERYQSAAVLADDLRRFQAGETIRARPVGVHVRLWRWCRREPLVASMAFALFAGLVGVATQWRRAESHLKDALEQRRLAEENEYKQRVANHALQLASERERTARRRAQERFEAAMSGLKRFEGVTQHEALLREPQFERLRAELLQIALDFYQTLQASLEEDASPDARSGLSEAYARVAQVTWELGRHDEALTTHRQALALVEQMAAQSPADREVHFALARCHTRIGFILRTMGRPKDAHWSYEQARAIQEPLVREHPGIARYREVLSWTLSNLGVIDLELGQPASAISIHQQAVAIHKVLLSQQPGNAQYRSDLGWCWRYLSQALSAAGDLGAAHATAEQAVALYEALVMSDRSAVEFRWRLGRCLDEIGRISFVLGRQGEAAAALDRAAEIHGELAGNYPVLYGADLIRNRLYAASQQFLAGRLHEATMCLQKVEDQIKKTPQFPRGALLHDLACSYLLWSVAEREGAIAEGEREARTQRAIAVLRRAILAGHADLRQVRGDPVLDPLRPRRDFQELLMDLEFPVDPFVRRGTEAGQPMTR
jgi:tetratricopeptide (TPR) repeat protein/tRNA A-37 threonylcarbamoyl transferase component Bud32